MRISDWSSDVCSSDLEYEKMRATAQASAHEALQKAQDEMKVAAERQGKALAAKLSQQTEEAEARTATAKPAALASLEGMAEEMAHAAPAKLTGVTAGYQETERAVGNGMGGQARCTPTQHSSDPTPQR